MTEAAQAFDPLAMTYDQVALSALGRHYRDRVSAAVDQLIEPGSRVLDLGCGTGIDAERLTAAGHVVTAVDGSPAMVAETQARLGQRAVVLHQDINSLDQSDLGPRFDLVLANFGVINCCHDLPRFGRWLDRSLTPFGVAVLVTMAPICPPELIQGVVGRNRLLFGRRRAGGQVDRGSGYADLEVRYHSARGLFDAMTVGSGAGLVLRHATALGVVLPTIEQRRLVEARPRLLSALAVIDRAVGGLAARTPLGDHQIVVIGRGSDR